MALKLLPVAVLIAGMACATTGASLLFGPVGLMVCGGLLIAAALFLDFPDSA